MRLLDWDREDNVQRLIDALLDPEPLVRGTSLVSLMHATPETLLPLLAGREGDTVSAEWRMLEIELLRRAAGPVPTRYEGRLCLWGVTLEPAELRARAAAACVERGSPAAATLEAIASDSAWPVRARLALALAGIPADGDQADRAREILDLLARDPHPTVRNTARTRRLVASPTPFVPAN